MIIHGSLNWNMIIPLLIYITGELILSARKKTLEENIKHTKQTMIFVYILFGAMLISLFYVLRDFNINQIIDWTIHVMLFIFAASLLNIIRYKSTLKTTECMLYHGKNNAKLFLMFLSLSSIILALFIYYFIWFESI